MDSKKKDLGGCSGHAEVHVWTWTALDSISKLLVSFVVGGRSEYEAGIFMDDLASRLDGPTQLSTDGLKVYEDAVR